MKIKIQNFTSIELAEIELGQFTLIIGPQGSGKSVVCKLIYFFLERLLEIETNILKSQTYQSFIDQSAEEFYEIFPLESWGKKKFKISLTDNNGLTISLSRKGSRHPGKTIKLEIEGKDFKRTYEDMFKSKIDASDNYQASMSTGFTRLRTFVNKIGLNLNYELLYVPAVRSLFSLVGSSILLDRKSDLDPISKKFARFWEYAIRNKIISENDTLFSDTTFNGKISVSKKGEIAINSNDERLIRIGQFSSGQLELLPLLAVKNYLSRSLLKNRERSSHNIVTFIEEPEAHLFPNTQNDLTKMLAKLANKNQIIVTTHSPYVLGCLNNIILSGQLAKISNEDTNEYGIHPEDIKVYCLQDGKSNDLKDVETGLISADYLDAASESINVEFDTLSTKLMKYE